MSTNDVIIGNVKRGSFKFPINFDLFGIKQTIPEATYDTGCSHSLISAKSLNLCGKDIDVVQEEFLYDSEITLHIGRGVESKEINIAELKKDIEEINKWKKQLRNKKVVKVRATQLLKQKITDDMKNNILGSKLVRYGVTVQNYEIDGVLIGDFKVRVSFKLGGANLIGMHIIKELYTKIFPRNDEIYLLAKKNSPLADCELDIAMDELAEQLDLYDDEKAVRDSNYINKIYNN